MFRKFIILTAYIFLLSGCKKSAETMEDQIRGTWIREGTNGTGSANTLYFSNLNGINTLSFDCSGSPGPGWPSTASTEYKFENGKLMYLNYYDNNSGFYTVDSFKWIKNGEEFEVQLRQFLLFMSATYVVKYQKVN